MWTMQRPKSFLWAKHVLITLEDACFYKPHLFPFSYQGKFIYRRIEATVKFEPFALLRKSGALCLDLIFLQTEVEIIAVTPDIVWVIYI